VLSGALGRLATLGDGLGREWNDPALQAALKDPRKFLDSDPADLLAIARMMVRFATNGTVLIVDFVGDLVVAILQSFKRLIDLRLNIPLFTSFVEKRVLKDRKLTVGIVLCLIPAIPTTVLYKAITGRKDGPAALASAGPRSFGGDDEAVDYLDIILRGVNLVETWISGGIDSIEALAGEVKGMDWAKWGFGAVGQLLGGAGLFKDTLGDKREGAAWVKYGFDIASWGTGFIGWIIGGIGIYRGSDAIKAVEAGCGIVSDAIGFISGVFDIVLNAIDDDASKADVAIASLDFAAGIGSLAASIGVAIPDPKANPDPLSKASILTTKSILTVGGTTVNLVGQFAALGVVIGASVA
jgi:hypothetical protein